MRLWQPVVVLSLLLAGCSVGPDYHRPVAATPVAFKELAGWKIATPRAELPKGAWWSVYNDPLLDRLERRVVIDNQTVKASEAAYRQAAALVREAQAGFFPTLSLIPDISRSKQSTGGFSTSAGRLGKPFTEYSAQGSASWEVDLWGRIRRQVESEQASAEVSAADLANATLSAQAALAGDYFNLRYQDSLAQLLTDTVAQYRRALTIAQNQYNAGTTSRADVVTAEAQLKSAQAQLAGVGVLRAQYEHAIAVLAGIPPAALSIPPAPLTAAVPIIPPGLPSELLERRPDIAAAERMMAAQNAQIGVAVAAYYPAVTLTGSGGFLGSPLAPLFTAANAAWSLGASASETLLDGGLRTATVAAARAGYEQAVANYRQTVLAAFQQVEDALSNLRILEQQAAAEAAAVEAARRAVEVTLNEYRAGTVSYSSVITEQTQLLSEQQRALAVQQSRMLASVALIQALGGGWRRADLPPGVPLSPAAIVTP
jgi:NodT family efflux transporter outer membrane factor (OMF) lipoprotein